MTVQSATARGRNISVSLGLKMFFLLFAFSSLSPSHVLQTLPGQSVAVRLSNHQAAGGVGPGDSGGRDAQDHGRLGALRQRRRDQGIHPAGALKLHIM